MHKFYSSGKLLLTGEYVVLDGALALAVPTKFGQSLVIEEIEESKLVWKSLDEKGSIWFEAEFDILNNEILNPVQDAKKNSQLARNDNEISNRLLDILQAAQQLNPKFLKDKKGYKITTLLEFPKNWGLGTSSTLVNNIANWANVDAYPLLEKTFGGSGYDIACAQHDSAITYQLNKPFECTQGDKRIIHQIHFNPVFKAHLYFVYLNKKQNSRDGIAQYKKNTINLKEVIFEINIITQKIIACKTLDAFNLLIDTHEQIIAKTIQLKPIKEMLFNDFNGSIKSLGAWGGDFVMVSSNTNPTTYFNNKGFETILTFDEMVASTF